MPRGHLNVAELAEVEVALLLQPIHGQLELGDLMWAVSSTSISAEDAATSDCSAPDAGACDAAGARATGAGAREAAAGTVRVVVDAATAAAQIHTCYQQA